MSKEMMENMFLASSQAEFNELLLREGQVIKDLCNCMFDMADSKVGLFVDFEVSAARVEDFTERYVELMDDYKRILDREKAFLDKFAEIYRKNYGKEGGDER